MLTIGLGPVSPGGGGGGGSQQNGQSIFDLEFVETTATARVVDTTITDFPNVDTSMLTDFSSFFEGCINLEKVADLKTSKSNRFANMFYNCQNLKEVPKMDTSNASEMTAMLYTCKSIKTLPIMDVSKVTYITQMCYSCTSLETIPAMDFLELKSASNAFSGCSVLKTVGPLAVPNMTSSSSMFRNCYALESCYLSGLKIGISFEWSSKLSKESVLYIFENAQTVTTTQTITLHADTFAQLTEDEIAIATEKGFSVVSA